MSREDVLNRVRAIAERLVGRRSETEARIDERARRGAQESEAQAAVDRDLAEFWLPAIAEAADQDMYEVDNFRRGRRHDDLYVMALRNALGDPFVVSVRRKGFFARAHVVVEW